MANEKPARFVTDAWLEAGAINYGGSCLVGDNDGDSAKGALRFTNIDIAKDESFDMCQLLYKYSSVGGSGQWRFKINGIDEDNTAFFGYPFGRSLTSAENTYSESQPTSGGTKTMNVKSIVEEITSRGGWSRNNALGFILRNDGSDFDVYAFADLVNSYLVYRIAAEPNFLPNPITIVAPTFPAVDDVGMKISFPGHEVLTAAEHDLLFTTRKEVPKIKAEAQTSTTLGVEKLIAHGLDYKPECFVFVRKNNLSFELPRLFGGATDPVGGGVQGYFSVDDDYLRVTTFTDADIYYYILLNEQAT